MATYRFSTSAANAGANFDRIRQWLDRQYSNRQGYRVREGLYWPKTGWQQHQINFYLGPRAGFEIAFSSRPGARDGQVVLRPHGSLNDKLIVTAAACGVFVALLVLLLLLAEGFAWDSFIVPYPVRAYGGPHMSGGAILIYAIVPAVAAGFVTFAFAWPFTLLGRPLCLAANRAEGLPVLPVFAYEIRRLCRALDPPSDQKNAALH